MANMIPIAVYGLQVPADGSLVPAISDEPRAFRITMAALDPSAPTKKTAAINKNTPLRSTLKLIYSPIRDDSDDEDAYMRALQDGVESDGLSDEEDASLGDEETNGGPSDLSKSSQAKKDVAAKRLMDSLAAQDTDESDSEMNLETGSPKTNGDAIISKASKGKAKAKVSLLDEDESDDSGTALTTEVVLCTLDTTKAYQQPIDITIFEEQEVFFKVSGTHDIHLTGNFVVPDQSNYNRRFGEEDEYDLSPDEDEMSLEDDEESDELDDVEDPRITEVDTDDENDEAVPQLVKQGGKKQANGGKGTNKRPAEDSEEDTGIKQDLDDLIAKTLKPEQPATNGEAKLSKKQLKKLKNNAGKAVDSPVKEDGPKNEPATKPDKKVQFAKNLEQGPTSSPSTVKGEVNGAMRTESQNSSLGVKVIQGVKIDDRKLGEGRGAKKGDKLGMRYIGKLSDGKVFDANKKGAPFSFKLGAGDVIKGWDIGVAGLAVKGERRIVVPAHLGYGSKKQGTIPSNSELTFDIKLLSIN